MIRVLIFLVVGLLFAPQILAQHGNEWLEPGRIYAKIPVAETGFYKLTEDFLRSRGFPVSVDPKKFKIYHRGTEIAIKVQGEDDRSFDAGDHIEFYGQKNDGTLDKFLYRNGTAQPHSKYSLFNDTAYYFLTASSTDGKRIPLTNESVAGLTAATVHHAISEIVLTNDYSSGVDYGEVINSVFDTGEGFMGDQILHNQSRTYSVSNIVNPITTGALPSVELMVTGRGPMNHVAEIAVGPSLRVIGSVSVSAFSSAIFQSEIQWSDIQSGQLNVRVTTRTAGASSARVSVNYLQLTYPQAINISGNLQLPLNFPASSSKHFFQVAGAGSGLRAFDVTTPGEPSEILVSGNPSGGVAPNESVILVDQFLSPAALAIVESVSFQQNSDFVIITNNRLRSPAGSVSDPVEAYAAYRQSEAGGSFQTTIVDIDQLYDHFTYGEKSPLAIYRYIRFISETSLPSYLFIIGKGLNMYYNAWRNPTLSQYNLVPTAGYPGSDLLFSIPANAELPAIPTGRLPAVSSADVVAYLNKVKEKEALPFNDLRRKNILHLSGGIYSFEPQLFRSFLQSYEPIATGNYFGGEVKALAKLSTDLKLINIADEVNRGVSLVTFFGHSSPTTLDFDVGFVSDPVMGYNNRQGKYPVLLMNGCGAGDVFLNGEIFGEDWITTPQRGASGFIAHSSFGFASHLREYSRHFYEAAFSDSVLLSKGTGDIQLAAAHRYFLNSEKAEVDITQVQQMVLLGDPAVPLFGAARPDYSIVDDNVNIKALNGAPLTANSDSIALTFIVNNFGQARQKPLKVRVVRYLNDRSTLYYDSTYQTVNYSDTLSFVIRGKHPKIVGLNTFEIRIDAEGEIEELTEQNNTAYIDYVFPDNSSLNLFPYDYSIANTREVTFAFQHTDVFSGEREFQWEIDSVNTFDSPFKTSVDVTASVLATVPFLLPETDTTTYYWRSRIATPLPNESSEWQTSSFTYIHQGPKGWMQRTFEQFEANELAGLTRDVQTKLLAYQTTTTSVMIRTFGGDASGVLDQVSAKINGAEYHLRQQGFGCRTNTLNLIAFEKTTTTPYLGVIFNWQNRAGRTCGREPWIINSFTPLQMASGNNDDLLAYVRNVRAGDSVVLFTIGDAMFSAWPAAAKEKLGEIGISLQQLQELQNGEPVVILARKGASPGAARIIRSALSPSEPLDVSTSVSGGSGYGEMKSVRVGPALEWHQLSVNADLSEVRVDVWGVNQAGQEILLHEDVTIGVDLSGVNVESYPYLKLTFKATDPTFLTPATLKFWTIDYDPAPEGVLLYDGNTETEQFQEGQLWEGAYRFINVSDVAFPDSVDFSYRTYNQQTLLSASGSIRVPAPLPGTSAELVLPVDTRNRVGINDVEALINPNTPENQRYNNIVSLPLKLEVFRETDPPIIEVTVDSRHISNGEIVSSSPLIEASVWDANPFLLIRDTTSVDVFIGPGCEGCILERLSFLSSDVVWSPATSDDAFRIAYHPHDLPEGIYVFRVVARDASGNATWNPYEITFEIAQGDGTSVMSPFPNPSTDRFNFRIDVRDSDLLPRVSIRILSPDGKLQQENFYEDIYPGMNVLSLDPAEWNPGLYLYEIRVLAGGKSERKTGRLIYIKK